MRVLLTALVMTVIAQPVWANCDRALDSLSPDSFAYCQTPNGDLIVFANSGGRSLSEAYCYSFGILAAFAKEDFSSFTEKLGNNLSKEVMDSKSVANVCDLKIVREEYSEGLRAADGTYLPASTLSTNVTISRGESVLTCGYDMVTDDEDSSTFTEYFDESQNLYKDLVHPSNPPRCGPDEMFKILESKPMDDGSYWSVTVAHRVKAAKN